MGGELTVEPSTATAHRTRRLGKATIAALACCRATRGRAVHLAEASVVVAVMAIFACLPLDTASAVGGWIGRTVGPRLGLSRRAMRNLRRAMPEKSETEHRRVVRAMWDNLGRTMAEYPHLAWICSAASRRVEIVNGDRLAALTTDGAPGIVFGAHFGNWEIAPVTLHRLVGVSLLSVYRAANNPWIDALLQRLRQSPRAVPKGSAGGRAVVRHLHQGGHLAMFVDQKMNDGIAVPFFGRQAMTAPALARLGLRFDCPLVPVRVERVAGARFRVIVLPALETVDAGEDAVLATMSRVNAMLEGWIRARPEQWLWLHKRWPD
jgi:Kdo2-lipid IVA lauroyltransferase/acyltransferase